MNVSVLLSFEEYFMPLKKLRQTIEKYPNSFK